MCFRNGNIVDCRIKKCFKYSVLNCSMKHVKLENSTKPIFTLIKQVFDVTDLFDIKIRFYIFITVSEFDYSLDSGMLNVDGTAQIFSGDM